MSSIQSVGCGSPAQIKDTQHITPGMFSEGGGCGNAVSLQAPTVSARDTAFTKHCQAFFFGESDLWSRGEYRLKSPGSVKPESARQGVGSTPTCSTNRIDPAAMVAIDNGPTWGSYHVNIGSRCTPGHASRLCSGDRTRFRKVTRTKRHRQTLPSCVDWGYQCCTSVSLDRLGLVSDYLTLGDVSTKGNMT